MKYSKITSKKKVKLSDFPFRISAQDLIGPGFGSVTGIQLTPGQMVFVTHCNREMQGAVLRHKANLDQVVIQLLVSSKRVPLIIMLKR